MKTMLMVFFTWSSLAIAATASTMDVGGTWNLTIESQTGTSTSTLVLENEGEAITGTYTGQFGTAPVTGTVKGSDVVMTFNVEVGGVPLSVTYSGTVNGNDMKGKVSVVGFGEGTFTAVRRS